MLLSLLKVHGHSMEPGVKEGQFVLATSLRLMINRLKAGDIAVFEKDGKLIIKRIVKFDQDLVLFSGDNSSDSRDFGWIKKSEIKGKVILKL